MVRKMPYSRFNLNWEKIKQLRDEEYSYAKYKRKRAYHNESIQSHFIKDVFNLLNEVNADIIYLDPPYTGTMNNYFGFYGLKL